jgi:phosphatidylserine/phosphatidylglycerophosphate/cardiolipin synthase-like enzyme
VKVIDVYVECEVLTVRLQLGPRSRTSVLETLVLKAVDAGVTTMQGLADLFGLTPRLMVDLLGDLWRRQRVFFEFDEFGAETIRLSPLAAEELAKLPEGHAIDAALSIPDTEDVLLDTLTGRVLPMTAGRFAPGRANLVITRSSQDWTAANVEPDALAAALNRSLERRKDTGLDGDMQVLQAYLAPKDLTKAAFTKFAPLSVQAGLDGGRLVVRVVDKSLPSHVQLQAESRLQLLVETEPESSFVQALRGAADQVVDRRDDIHQDLAGFVAAAGPLVHTAPANRRRDHDRTASRADNLVARVKDMAERQMSVTVVRTSEEHRRAIVDLIDAAAKQVVISVPWLKYRGGIESYVDALKRAVRRGVEVTVLWGIDRDEGPLDPRVVDALHDVERVRLASGGTGAVRYDRAQPAHVHAKVVLVDDRQALVTSKNFASHGEHAEVGLVVRAADDAPAPVLDELLEWTHQTSPNYDHACAIIRDRNVFGDRSRAMPHVVPPRPEFAEELETVPEDATSVALWSRSWATFGASLADSVSELGPVVGVVRDHLHSYLLWDGLGVARSRVLISSDQFSAAVVNDGFVERIRQCLRRGVNVALVYRRTHRQRDDDECLQKLRALADGPVRDGAGRLTVVHDGQSHAKVLVIDDEVVVGSYNFLSFEGRSGAGRRKQRSEISLRVLSSTLADDISRPMLGDQWAGWSGNVRRTVAAQRDVARGQVDIAATRVLAALRRTGSSFDPKEIVAACRPLPSPFDVADVLAECGATDDELIRLNATMYSFTEQDGADHRHWGRLLFGSLWAGHDWRSAYAVRLALPDDGAPVSVLLSAAATAFGAPSLPKLIASAMEDDYRALCAYASVDLLLNGCGDLIEPVELLAEFATDDRVRAFAAAAVAHVTTRGQLPIQALRSRAATARTATVSDEIWDRVRTTLTAFERYDPNCANGDATKDYLAGDAGPLAVLRGIVERKDAARLGTWTGDNGTNEGHWLDDATRAAKQPLLTDNRRKSMLIKSSAVLRAVRRATNDLRALGPTTDRVITGDELTEIDAIAEHARQLKESLPAEPRYVPAVWAFEKLTNAVRGEADV